MNDSSAAQAGIQARGPLGYSSDQMSIEVNLPMKLPSVGLVRFQTAMAEFSGTYIGPAWAGKKRGESLVRSTDRAFEAVFLGFTEITNALEALTLTETLIGLAAPRSSKVEKDKYLKFLIGAYLQEVYILEQRLSAYATKLCRIYKLSSELPRLLAVVRDAFGGIVRTRGSHVHSQRYSDQKLDILSTMAMVSRFQEEFTDEMHFEYKVAQLHWRKTVKANNAATRVLIDGYFDLLFPQISKAGKFVLPRTGCESPHTSQAYAQAVPPISNTSGRSRPNQDRHLQS